MWLLCDRCGYEGSDCPFPQEKHCEMFEERKAMCGCCEKEYPRIAMEFTTDCHGIPFRLVCPTCYDELMKKGYDGEYYSEIDECIDFDW